ncbi:monovalent cation/H(+) antiporter subunit G [Rhodococcus sp. CSLK01-03]|uniref:Cation:proton antiporter n=2 Tax=Rhodococcus TaxID=1827 RepID=A0A0M8PL98_RHORH|nr:MULTISPECIES: monovalent cation/H(+) antiporter subunit G [Rhodococcus]KOS57235.1 cation:proton antiporter [Rhodococcus rhodochrous KG-21]MDM7488940.1 monovalent cation/H(+) antiporter subunit G [Rhodococcus indonesiensis]
MITDILEVVGQILILVGSAVCLAGAIGVVRFRDTLTRMHPATMPQVVGVLLVLAGAILNLRGSVDIWMLVLASMFMVLTAPVVAHRVGRVAYREQLGRDGLPMPEDLPSD